MALGLVLLSLSILNFVPRLFKLSNSLSDFFRAIAAMAYQGGSPKQGYHALPKEKERSLQTTSGSSGKRRSATEEDVTEL
jgi:hypothetical protein